MTNPNKLADALECFWNAALGATRTYDDATANAVMSGMVQGVAAVATRLRELDAASLAAPPAQAVAPEVAVAWQTRVVHKSNGVPLRDWQNIDRERYEAEKAGSEGDTLRVEYRALYIHPQPPSIPEPSDEDVEAAFKARWPLHWNVMSAAKRDYEMGEVRNIITTYTARLREKLK